MRPYEPFPFGNSWPGDSKELVDAEAERDQRSRGPDPGGSRSGNGKTNTPGNINLALGIRTAMAATKTIPIVFSTASDPVRARIVR